MQICKQFYKIFYTFIIIQFKMTNLLLFLLLIILSVLIQVDAVSFESLYQKQLKSSYGFQILKHYHSQPFGNQDVKKFKGETLMFMSPWRQEGIQMSIKYMKKFDYFAPCFYDLKKTNNSIELDTSKYYSQQYLKRVKQANPNVKIVPRMFVHGMQGDVFFLASTQDLQMEKMVAHFRTIAQNPYYDGVVFSSPFITPNHKYPFSMKNMLKQIKKVFKENNKLLMVMMEGVDDKPDSKINKKKARQIIDEVDKVIVSNYDYPKGNQGITIPISPMKWIKQNYEFYCQVYSKAKLTPKLIMAIPLYGYFVAMYGKYDPIEGKQFITKLKGQKQAWLDWNQQNQECMVYLNKMEYIYFPCLHFLDARLRYFQSLNVGLGAFQIGSGLQIFMQMF